MIALKKLRVSFPVKYFNFVLFVLIVFTSSFFPFRSGVSVFCSFCSFYHVFIFPAPVCLYSIFFVFLPVSVGRYSVFFVFLPVPACRLLFFCLPPVSVCRYSVFYFTFYFSFVPPPVPVCRYSVFFFTFFFFSPHSGLLLPVFFVFTFFVSPHFGQP